MPQNQYGIGVDTHGKLIQVCVVVDFAGNVPGEALHIAASDWDF